MKRYLVIFAIFAAILFPLRADFQTGLEAYNRGDFAAALAAWQPIAEKGDANAQYNVGLLYARGQGVPQDYHKAVEWYEKAAQQGVAAAQYNLGVIYANGQGGIPQNTTEARKWFEKAAQQGVAEAEDNVGYLYGAGQGVPKDYTEAEKWYRKAAEAGVASAQYNLAVMYDIGQGVTRDYNEALTWYRKAADQNYASALCNIGILYYNAQGVKRDLVESYAWMSRCQKAGDPRASQLVRILEGRMKPADIKRAQQLAEDWHPKTQQQVASNDRLFIKPEGTATADRSAGAQAAPAVTTAAASPAGAAGGGAGTGATPAETAAAAPAVTTASAPAATTASAPAVTTASAPAATGTAAPGGTASPAATTSAASLGPASTPAATEPASGGGASPAASASGASLSAALTPAGTTAPATVNVPPPSPALRPAAAVPAAKAPEKVQDLWAGVDRVVAVGDVHGDFEQFFMVLESAGLVDGNGDWVGGAAHLVQTGDIVDRGPDSRRVIDLLMKLEKQAAAAGGGVHCLIGNHEAMDVYGDLRYVSPGEFAAFRDEDSEAARNMSYEQFHKAMVAAATPDPGRESWNREHPAGFLEHRRAYSPSGKYGAWIAGHNTVIKIDNTLFVHAGISPKYLDWGMDRINNEVRRELNNLGELHGGIVADEQGPLWWSGLAKGDEAQLTSLVDQILQKYGVQRIVIGHTYANAAITPRFGGKVMLIDIGLSRIYDNIGKLGCLVIEQGKAYALHRGQKLELPTDEGADMLRYLKQAAALDPQPSPLAARIDKLARTVARP